MQDPHLSFLTPEHHAVRNFAVLQLPRNHGRPLHPAQFARALGFGVTRVEQLLGDLEQHLFFLARNRRGEVTWAFPLTCESTPHRVRFSTGEFINGA